MVIGTFRRNVGKTFTPKVTKLALRTASKNTQRTQIAQASVSLKEHTGRLLQITGPYVLGAQQTQEVKDEAFKVLGDIGFDLAALSRGFKTKLPSSTKKIKLVGTRGAAILQLDSLATDLLAQTAKSLFAAPKTTSVQKMVSMPQKGGVKEERTVEIVDAAAEHGAEAERQTSMQSFLSGAVDVYWRLCWDMTGQVPAAILAAKFERMKTEYPGVQFDTAPKVKKAASTATAAPAPKKKAAKAAEPVPA